jgi:hypothetical protein
VLGLVGPGLWGEGARPGSKPAGVDQGGLRGCQEEVGELRRLWTRRPAQPAADLSFWRMKARPAVRRGGGHDLLRADGGRRPRGRFHLMGTASVASWPRRWWPARARVPCLDRSTPDPDQGALSLWSYAPDPSSRVVPATSHSILRIGGCRTDRRPIGAAWRGPLVPTGGGRAAGGGLCRPTPGTEPLAPRPLRPRRAAHFAPFGDLGRPTTSSPARSTLGASGVVREDQGMFVGATATSHTPRWDTRLVSGAGYDRVPSENLDSRSRRTTHWRELLHSTGNPTAESFHPRSTQGEDPTIGAAKAKGGNSVPSGLQAPRGSSTGGRVPQPHRVGMRPGRGSCRRGCRPQRLPPKAARKGVARGLTGGRVPQPHRLVPAPRGGVLPSGCTPPGHQASWPLGVARGLTGGRVPQPHRSVPAPRARVLPSGQHTRRTQAMALRTRPVQRFSNRRAKS